jgi:hypothetical protein
MSSLFSTTGPFDYLWSGISDTSLRPVLIVGRDGSGFRPINISELGGSGSGGGGGSTTTNGQVGITGANGLPLSTVPFNGFNAIPVIITSGQTLVSGANINLTGIQQVEYPFYYNEFTPLGVSRTMSAELFPSFIAYSSFVVPSGKSLKIDGYAVRVPGTGMSFLVAIRDLMYAISATGNSRQPTLPTLTARTITGFNGLTTGATYNYRTVLVNNLGNTAAGPSNSITLSGSQNAIDVVLNFAIGDGYAEIYRSPANGGSGSEVYLTSTVQNLFSDCLPDSELSSDPAPLTNSSSGVYNGFAYPSGFSPRHVLLKSYQMISGITSVFGSVDVVYRNIYNKIRTFRINNISSNQYFEITPITQSGTSNLINPVPLRNPNHPVDDGGINQIVHLATNTPDVFNFAIYGYSPVMYVTSESINAWKTELFPKTIIIPEGKDVVITPSNYGLNFTLQNPSGRLELIIYGRLI